MLNNKKILITCGPTWIPIDDMRVISNRSTGKMGHLLALACQKAGAKVTLLEGPVEERLKAKSIKVTPFLFFNELQRLLKEELTKKFDVVIHAAAVSDYQLKKPFRTKLNFERKNLHLDLEPTPKLINLIKKYAPQTTLVGFKLESKMTQKTVVNETQKLFKDAKCDFVIANCLTKAGGYYGFLLNNSGVILSQENNREDMAQALIKQLGLI